MLVNYQLINYQNKHKQQKKKKNALESVACVNASGTFFFKEESLVGVNVFHPDILSCDTVEQ